MRKSAVTLTRPERSAAVSGPDRSRLPVRQGQKIPLPYVFVHYGEWQYDDAHGWLPVMAKVIAMPGVNGVGADGSLSGTLQVTAQRGGNIIDPHDIRLLQAGESKEDSEFYQYARFYLTTTGKKYWVEPGMEPTISANGRRVMWDKKKIGETLGRFRKHLRDSGIVQPMHRLNLDEELKLEQNRIDRLASRVGHNPHLQATLDLRKERLTQMEKAFFGDEEKEMKGGTKLKAKRSKKTLKAEVPNG